ncbi:zinc ribbon domain-containing protein [Streptomyces sp. NPDC058000]|uniref:zinc ribbon domain-containing protein n=1 Tax=Streptomyces sp. NPDC058000 TaxID=3346299 RepID=UPI0036E76A60
MSDRTFHCANCGLTMDRDLNAALNIERHTETPNVASDSGETQNARRAPVRLLGPRAGEQGAASRPALRNGEPFTGRCRLTRRGPRRARPAGLRTGCGCRAGYAQ